MRQSKWDGENKDVIRKTWCDLPETADYILIKCKGYDECFPLTSVLHKEGGFVAKGL